MKITKLALSLLVGAATGCTSVPPAPVASMPGLPNCFDANYDGQRNLFTMNNVVGNPANQQCLLTVWPRGEAASASRLTAGSYTVYLANGGGGGAGGTTQGFARDSGGGGGGGGAGAAETRATVDLTEGVYKLTLGAGGPGGSGCLYGPGSLAFGGGPGWIGSPSSIIRVATGEVVMGAPNADTYARPTRGQNERAAGKLRDGRGGSGPGQASGGQGGHTETKGGANVEATAGKNTLASGPSGQPGIGGEAGLVPHDDKTAGAGGGGGATSAAEGGDGGGETPRRKAIAPERGALGSSGRDTPRHRDIAPEHGSLGSGGGGGEGNSRGCGAGSRGGHGYIALRPI